MRRSLVHSLKRLTAHDVVLLLQAYWILWRTQLRLRSLPAGTLVTAVSAVQPQVAAGATDGARLDAARAVERAVVRAATYNPLRPLCLARALALHELLRSQGLTGGRVVIGVQLAGGFDAHAWVEYGGTVLGDSRSRVSRFVPLDAARVDGDS